VEHASLDRFLTKVGSNMQIPDFETNVIQAIIKKYLIAFSLVFEAFFVHQKHDVTPESDDVKAFLDLHIA
jgi:hypothetical protein